MKIKRINHPKGIKPQATLSVQRVEANVWEDLSFDKHHYLTNSLNKSCKCLLFRLNGEICAFVGILNTPRKGRPFDMAISRIVVLPEFQGRGLSTQILNFVGGVIKNANEESHLYIKTIHELMGNYFTHSSKWRPTTFNGKERKSTKFEGAKYKNRLKRISYCFEYIGDKIEGYDNLLLPIKELRMKKIEKIQPTLF